MFSCCHFGSSIDAAGACHRHRSQIAASANYKSGRHIASAVGKHAGQAAVLKRPAAKMCSQPRASSGVGASNECVEDATGLASGGNALGAAVAELSALSRDELRARATSLGVAHRDENRRDKTRKRLIEDCRLALVAQQVEVQQEAPRSGSALDVGA